MAGTIIGAQVLRAASPVLILMYFGASQAYATCFLPPSATQKSNAGFKGHGRWYLWLLMGLLSLVVSYVAESICFLLWSLLQSGWYNSQYDTAHLLLSVLAWGIQLLTRLDSKSDFWLPYYGSWVIGLFFEVAIQILLAVSDLPPHGFTWVKVALAIFRICLFTGLLVSFYTYVQRSPDTSITDEESQSLLKNQDGSTNAYGTTQSADRPTNPEEEEARKNEQFKKSLEESGGWWAYAKSFGVLVPYVLPTKSKVLQLRLVGVVLCIAGLRALNLLIPRQLGIVAQSLVVGSHAFPWMSLFIYGILRLLGGSNTGLDLLQSVLYLPIEQHAVTSVTEAAYNKIMDLSVDFHNSKRSGQLFESIRRGQSLADLAETLAFKFLPMVLDLVVAAWYFFHLFGATMSLIVVFTTVIYIYTVTKLTGPELRRRRPYVNLYRQQHARLVESISNWETVTMFNRQEYEKARFSESYKKHTMAYRDYFNFSNLTNAVQSLIFTLGFLSAAFVAVYQISNGSQTVGNFVTLLTYWYTITMPLTFIGQLSATVTGNLLESEELVRLLQKESSIQEKSSAYPLQVLSGSVEFDGVSFAYDGRKEVLHKISFKAEGGKTVALVGETGGGKSTILKLLFRFYDATNGSIKVDENDVKDVTLHSLREIFGVVPQSPTMFNDTILANLQYARDGSTQSEIEGACKAAAIHDKIMSFTDGYQTVVGERGVKLSGGEVQRIAIARAILKQSKIILLDEATSSVDVETESNIQIALKNLMQNRTTFVIAHRLSTIMNADLILVVHGGEIVQAGSHKELIDVEGRYHRLWSKQILEIPPTKKFNELRQQHERTQIDGTDSDSPNDGQNQTSCPEQNELSKAENELDRDTHNTSINDGDTKTKSSMDETDDQKIETVTTKKNEAKKSIPSRHVKGIVQNFEGKQQEEASTEGSKSGDKAAKVSKSSQLKPDAPDFVPMRTRSPQHHATKPLTQSSRSGHGPAKTRVYESQNASSTSLSIKESWSQRRAREKREKSAARKDDKSHYSTGESTKDRLVKRSSSFFQRKKKPDSTQSTPPERSEEPVTPQGEHEPPHIPSETNLDGAGDDEGQAQQGIKKKRQRKRRGAISKHADKDSIRPDSGTTIESHPSTEVIALAPSIMTATVVPNEATDIESSAPKPELRYPYSRRRGLSRSEPAPNTDGSVDDTARPIQNKAVASVRDALPPSSNNDLIGNRRASAPSDPPSGPYDQRGASPGQRRRQRKHWKQQHSGNSYHYKSGSGSSSGATLVYSKDGSSSTGQTLPRAPATSPATASGTVTPVGGNSNALSRLNVSREVHFAEDA